MYVEGKEQLYGIISLLLPLCGVQGWKSGCQVCLCSKCLHRLSLSLTSELLPYLKISSNHRMSSKWERLSLDWKMQQFRLEAIFERESAVWSNLWSFSIWAWGRPCCLLPSPCTETAGRHLSSRKARWPINAKDYHHQNTSHLNWVCLAAVSGFHEVV